MAEISKILRFQLINTENSCVSSKFQCFPWPHHARFPERGLKFSVRDIRNDCHVTVQKISLSHRRFRTLTSNFFFKITFSIQIEMMHRSLYLYSNFVDTLVAGISLLLAMQVKVYSSY